MRGHLTPWPLEGTGEPEANPSVPQQEEQPDATEGEAIVDYDLDVDYEGLEHENEPVAQEEKEKISNAEYANSLAPSQGSPPPPWIWCLPEP